MDIITIIIIIMGKQYVIYNTYMMKKINDWMATNKHVYNTIKQQYAY